MTIEQFATGLRLAFGPCTTIFETSEPAEVADDYRAFIVGIPGLIPPRIDSLESRTDYCQLQLELESIREERGLSGDVTDKQIEESQAYRAELGASVRAFIATL